MKKCVWSVGLITALLLLAACDKKEEPPEKASVSPLQQDPVVQPTPGDQAMPPSGAKPMTDPMAAGEGSVGQKVYEESCQSCHAEGIAGAPRLGDQAAWAERIDQGLETLTQKSIEGFSGETGMMPARGGNASLSDEEVRAAVEYMVLQSR